MIKKIDGFEINENKDSSRIVDINIYDEILNKLIFPFNKFDITALEYKPFTRFTVAKNLDDLSNDPVGQEDFVWGSPKSKNVDYKVEHPVFTKDKNGKPVISYIDQFPEPKNMKQGLFLQKLSDALEQSKNKISFPLPVGSTIFSNNYFWLHGRKAFKEHSGLSRELLRIRGTFFH